MELNNFKVIFSRKDLIVGSFYVLVLEFIIIFIVQSMHPDGLRNLLNSIIGIVFLAFLPSVILYFVVTRLLYYIKVNGSNITFKTRYGRKYSFTCRDINKVACFTDNDPKHGVSHDIGMKVDMDGKQVNTYVFSSMIGFSTMAAYLLEMHERGEIKEEAISKSCKKMLTKYKNLEDRK